MIKIKSNNSAPEDNDEDIKKIFRILKSLSKLTHHHHACREKCYCGLTKIREELDEIISKL